MIQPNYKGHKELHEDKAFSRMADQAIEEMSELVVALMHHRRGRVKDYKHIQEEIADVNICLDGLVHLIDNYEEYWSQYDLKSQRLNEKIDKNLKKKKNEANKAGN